MKQRILELLSTPENIVAEDLALLKEEIAVQPYAQSLRALYLLGTKKYDADNFQKILSTTAAYTTDKKILYQFINGKIYEPKTPDLIVEKIPSEVEEMSVVSKDDETIVNEALSENSPVAEKEEAEGNWISELPEKKVPEKIIVDGEVNRILFPGEENFLNEENSVQIDLESTQESGVLVAERIGVQADENPVLIEKSPEKFKEDLLALNAEMNGKIATDSPGKEQTLIENKDVIDNNPVVNEPVENILMEPEIDSPIKKEVVENKLNTKIAPENKYETERKRLAKQVELMMSQSKKPTLESKESEADAENDATVDFFQTQEFSLGNADGEKQDVKIDVEKKEDLEIESMVSTKPENVAVNRIDDDTATNSNWKPMQAANQTASKSRFSKTEDASINESIPEVEMKEEKVAIEEQSETEAEVEPLHISFFAPTITSIEKKEEKIEEPPVVEEPVAQEIPESNVPTFINTWQSWLKLDRSQPEIDEVKEEDSKVKIKSEAIDKFIDAAPKISKLKEDSTFTVKEKKDDIAHLTTETLAKLFLSQKLYAKAINAYKILKEKYPERTAEFDERIAEIKVLRQK